MKVQKFFGAAALALAVATSGAFAHHLEGELGTVDALQGATQELNQVVQSSFLRFSVKQTVYNLVYSVNALNACVDAIPEPPPGIAGSSWHHHDGVPQQCGFQFSQVQQAFSRVDYYLCDTQFDMPQVYEAYQDVAQTYYALRVH